jgi:hypothetical protein
MGNKESARGIKIIKTLNPEIKTNVNNNNNNNNKKKNNKNKNKDSNNSTLMTRPKIRRNAHTVQFLPNKNTNEMKLKTRNHIMTDEQRKIFKCFLKENAKENKRSIAKNLKGFFFESYKKNHLLKNKIENNNEIDKTLAQNHINKEINQNLNEPINNNKQNSLRTILTLPQNKFSKKNLYRDKLKIDSSDKYKIGNLATLRNKANVKDKVSFTTYSKLQKDSNPTNINKNHLYSTPRTILGQTHIEKKFI